MGHLLQQELLKLDSTEEMGTPTQYNTHVRNQSHQHGHAVFFRFSNYRKIVTEKAREMTNLLLYVLVNKTKIKC